MAEEVQGEEVVLPEGGTGEEGVQGEEVVTLPSDAEEFVIPEKFAGKSVEDVIKSYQELEKFKGGGQESKGEEQDEGQKEESPEQTAYNKYVKSFEDNGTLSEAEYAELAELGYNKEAVNKEIQRVSDAKEFEAYKAQKTIEAVLEPLGGGQEKFQTVAEWANQTKDAEEVKAFNEALAAAPKLAQQALLRGLYAEYDASGVTDVLHTNSPQGAPTRGYASEADFFKDIGAPEYSTHRTFAAAVQAKLEKTDTTGWAIG